jgi:hypothetical protein
LEPLIHFAIPLALASILRLKPRWALAAGVFGVLPDLDILTFMHRSVSHTILPPLAILLILIPWKRARANPPLMTLCLGWGTHVLLDLIAGYTPILWPLSMNSYQLVLESTVHVGSTPLISARLNILQQPYNYGAFTTLDAPILTAEGLAIASTLTILAAAIQGILKTPGRSAGKKQLEETSPPHRD